MIKKKKEQWNYDNFFRHGWIFVYVVSGLYVCTLFNKHHRLLLLHHIQVCLYPEIKFQVLENKTAFSTRENKLNGRRKVNGCTQWEEMGRIGEKKLQIWVKMDFCTIQNGNSPSNSMCICVWERWGYFMKLYSTVRSCCITMLIYLE